MRQALAPGSGEQGIGRLQRHVARSADQRFMGRDARIAQGHDGLKVNRQRAVVQQA